MSRQTKNTSGKVILDLSISLDGYMAGSDIDFDNPMGKGGERIHEWMFSDKTEADQKVLRDAIQNYGAVILGNHTYRLGIKSGWGGVSPFMVPALVVAHKKPEDIPEGFIFVEDGIENALRQAKEISGSKDIWVMGGADIAQQFMKARLIDEVNIHVIPILLLNGIRLFENLSPQKINLNTVSMIQTPAAIHIKALLKYD